jgi:hypothetical protein
MPTDPLTPQNDQSVKLSVTVKSQLERKYNDAALEKIRAEIGRWKKADADRGIRTVHVEVDNSEDETMKEQVLEPVSGDATPEKIKQVIDLLWDKLTPDYLVLFGGHDIIPMFEVTNPTYLWEDEDNDKTVLTDNPYASSAPFSKDDENSYQVPDRVIGRIPDMVSAAGDNGRNGDPEWFVEYLKTARNWESKSKSFYKEHYVICTGEAKEAGMQCVYKAFEPPTLPPLICPPDSDDSARGRQQLSAPLHMIKCHGNKNDATFWGFEDESKDKPHAAITSATLRQLPYSEGSTVVAAMCCYGAQIFSPKDADTWPLASTYLRKGALGFVGSTMKAWVGLEDMSAADWIVADYLRRVLEGASIGRAFLESKQDNPGYHYTRGHVLGPEEKKTVIEYILLGDPSIHPVSSVPDCANELAIQERRQRRVARALIGAGMRNLLPTRYNVTAEEKDKATEVFTSKLAQDAIKNLKGFNIRPTAVRVHRLDTRFPESPETARDRSAVKSRQSLEFYWHGKRDRGGEQDKQLCLLKVETDLQRRPWRASVLCTS